MSNTPNLRELLAQFDIDAMRVMDGDLTVLTEIHTKYEEMVGEVRTSVTASDSQLSTALNTAKADEELVKLAKQVQADIWEIIFPAIDENPMVAVLLFENFKEVNGVVKYERDYFLNSSNLTPANVASLPDPEKQENAEKLGTMLRSLLAQFDSLGVAAADFKAVLPGEVSDKSGKFIPKMSKLRDKSENSNAGRPVSGSRYRFNWNGEDLPAKTTPGDVAHHFISDRKSGYIVKWSEIADMVKAAGKKIGDDFTLEIPNRGTLKAWVPSDSE